MLRVQARLRQGLKLAHTERLAASRELLGRFRQPISGNRLAHLHVLGQFDYANHGLGQRLALCFAEHLAGRQFFERALLRGAGHAEDQ